MLHYHIRWGTGELDWERHDTRDKAEKFAEQLVLPDEEYTIEEVREEKCPACNEGAVCRVVPSRNLDTCFAQEYFPFQRHPKSAEPAFGPHPTAGSAADF